jgi:Purple acid Phosphatase, N-terminal domain/Calcineurin-like phosphoesterase
MAMIRMPAPRGRQHTWARLALALALCVPALSGAAVKNVRVVWDAAPDTQAVIAFSKDGSAASTGQVLKYGSSPVETSWQTQGIAATRVFKSSLTNYFVRLTNLTPDTEYFFRACDASGCTDAHVFRTAPADSRSLTVIAGGDSRTDRAARQQGMRLVQKIRPRFVMFSGDYTDSHSASEVDTWLADWTLSFTPTTVNGRPFKQVYPIVPTVGNHESSDMQFMCTVFGVDADANGTCSLRDTYNAFNVGSLLRLYTLNTEFGSSQANERSAQRAWLNGDLPAHATETRWRFAQYHKPMFPRSSSKPASHQIALDWAAVFYDFRMNLVNESDTHLVKYTLPVRLNGSDYESVAAGPVYIGEGAWGAPVRTADRSSPWIIDQDSFSHLNVLQVSADTLDVRTVVLAQEASVLTLDKARRDQDPLALPEGLTLWDAAGAGPVFSLRRDAQGHTQLDETLAAGTSTSRVASRDVSVGSGGFYNNGNTAYADGKDGSEERRALLAWDLAGVPAEASLTSVYVSLNIVDTSPGTYHLHAVTAPWAEAGATFAQASSVGALIGTLKPASGGTASIQLNTTGMDLVRDWIRGTAANHGMVLLSAGSADGVDFSARESGKGARLVVNH